MFSLCITTMDRYDSFLSISLPKYLENNLIDEIIITDENGNDIEKIKKNFPNNEKLILIQNEKRLGPFLNKIKVCSFAKNEWIVLMDSDNFADNTYFLTAKEYINKIINNQNNIILAPSKANPQFNYKHLSGFIYKKNEILNNNKKELVLIKQGYNDSMVLMNTGNYVINKNLFNKLDLSNETNNIYKSSACDVIYFNTLLFEQTNVEMHVVDELEYEHVVHPKSTYITTKNNHTNFNNEVYTRFKKLI